MTDGFLHALRKQPSLPRNTWYFIAGTTLSALNRPEEIPAVYNYAIENLKNDSHDATSLEERLHVARRLREALVKSTAVCGLPKVCTKSLLISSFAKQ